LGERKPPPRQIPSDPEFGCGLRVLTPELNWVRLGRTLRCANAHVIFVIIITTHAKHVRSLATERHVAVFPAHVRIHRVAPRSGRVPRIRIATEVDGEGQFRDGEVVALVGVRVRLLRVPSLAGATRPRP